MSKNPNSTHALGISNKISISNKLNLKYFLGLCERTLLQPDPALHQAVITLPIKDEKKPVQGLLQHQNFETLLGGQGGGVRASGAGQYMQTDNTGQQVLKIYRVSLKNVCSVKTCLHSAHIMGHIVCFTLSCILCINIFVITENIVCIFLKKRPLLSMHLEKYPCVKSLY